MSTETAPTFDPSACPECGGPIHEFAYVDTYQRVTLQMDDAGEELEVSDYPTVFETGEDFRDVTYGCRSCCTFGMSLADLLDAHRAKIAA